MSIQLQDTAIVLSALIVLCFSFCILVITIWYKNAEVLPRLLGYSFISAFFLDFSSLLVKDKELSAVFSQIAEPLLLLLIMLAIAAKPKKKSFNLFFFIIIISPLVLISAVIFSLPVRSFLSQQLIFLSTSVVISAVILYLLKKEKGDMNLLFWSILPLQASIIAQHFLFYEMTVFAAPLLKLGAYTALLVFFYRVFLSSQLARAEETEKKLAAVNHSIEHEVKKRMLEIEKVNKKLLNISKIDSMSQVMNKAALLDSIDTAISKNPKSEFSIILFDIDNFKTINDTLGHVTGDKCIKTLSVIAKNNMREFDLVGRYGGDEFIIVLPDIETNLAIMIAERFRQRVDLSDSPHFTISIGIATYPKDGTDVKALIEAADKGMYKSKSKGRNAVSHKDFY